MQDENVQDTPVSGAAADPDFVRVQYAQYWDMMRFHLSLSWQIPALAVVAVVALLGFDAEALTKWMDAPLVPAVALLLIGLFMVVMFVHHRRNLLFVRLYEETIAAIEKDYGVGSDLHHFQVQSDLNTWERLSSSSMLSALLLLLAAVSLGASIYFFVNVFA